MYEVREITGPRIQLKLVDMFAYVHFGLRIALISAKRGHFPSSSVGTWRKKVDIMAATDPNARKVAILIVAAIEKMFLAQGHREMCEMLHARQRPFVG